MLTSDLFWFCWLLICSNFCWLLLCSGFCWLLRWHVLVLLVFVIHFIHACTHVRMHAHTHACMHTRMHTRMHTHTHAHTHAHTHTRTHARTHTHMYTLFLCKWPYMTEKSWFILTLVYKFLLRLCDCDLYLWPLLHITTEHTKAGHHLPSSETPFQWLFTGGLMVARNCMPGGYMWKRLNI